MEAEQSNWNLCWLKDLADELDEGTSLSEVPDKLLIARLSLEPASLANSWVDRDA
jgi:hypothetical protein